MNRTFATLSSALFLAAAVIGLSQESAAAAALADNGRGSGPVIFVTEQGLYYDSIVVVDPLPSKGRFQLLEMGPGGLQTQFGPGNRGYVGGRWKEDFDGDGNFHYFLCPLLGPGRTTP